MVPVPPLHLNQPKQKSPFATLLPVPSSHGPKYGGFLTIRTLFFFGGGGGGGRETQNVQSKHL